MIYLTKQYKFCAAHRYWNDNWSDQKNKEVFDEDVRIHGHNYILSITVKGMINNDSGFIIDIKELIFLITHKLKKILIGFKIDSLQQKIW